MAYVEWVDKGLYDTSGGEVKGTWRRDRVHTKGRRRGIIVRVQEVLAAG
jgi:hypothetical protein